MGLKVPVCLCWNELLSLFLTFPIGLDYKKLTDENLESP